MKSISNKIILGGGNNKKEGYLNLDILNFPNNVDIVCDLEEGIPLKNDSVDEVLASHFLEHINDTIKIMEEIYRVCCNGAIVKIKVPYFKSIGAFKDPSHVSFFTEETFKYFDKDQIKGKLPDYKIEANFKTLKISFLWSSKFVRFLPFKNLFLKHFWNIARTIYFELKVVKK